MPGTVIGALSFCLSTTVLHGREYCQHLKRPRLFLSQFNFHTRDSNCNLLEAGCKALGGVVNDQKVSFYIVTCPW